MSLLSGSNVNSAPAKTGGERASRSKARRKAKYEAAVKIQTYLKDKNAPADILEAIGLLAKAPGSRVGGFGGTPVFNRLFGDAPKVGDKITISDVFNKTMKGVAQMNSLMRKWAEKGIEVKYTHLEAEPFKSFYEIVKLA